MYLQSCASIRRLTISVMFQEKLAIKQKKEADEAKFKFAQVYGRTEQVLLLY